MVGFGGTVPGGCDGGQVFAQGLYDSPAPHPEPSADTHPSVQEQPDGRGRVGDHRAAVVQEPEGHQWTDGVAAKPSIDTGKSAEGALKHPLISRLTCSQFT